MKLIYFYIFTVFVLSLIFVLFHFYGWMSVSTNFPTVLEFGILDYAPFLSIVL